MLEPFQADKIPLILVHGLLSNRFTWANIANETIACPELMNQYQIWVFQYATGEPFLESAAVLRRQLTEIRGNCDEPGQHGVLERTVLVGHSMGGLVSKLMVTESSDCLWRAVSRRPLESIQTCEKTRSRLANSFFFRPHESVSRVVYIGTPHRGSPFARRPIGKLGAKLVEEPSSTQQIHQQLIRDNPETFSREFSRRVPTSVDLLRADSSLLQAIDSLPAASWVHQHSIVGSGYPMIGALNSDGVVPLRSSVKFDVETHLSVQSRHVQIHKHEKSIAELFSILRLHLIE